MKWAKFSIKLFSLLGFSFLIGCSASPTPTSNVVLTDLPTEQQSTITPLPTNAPTLTLTPPITLTSTVVPVQITSICSPLEGIGLSDLHGITSQSFKTPSAYLDDGHPAVDLAFFTFEGFPSMLGHPVQSILPGVVVQVVEDRYPYGNMILIETPLDQLPDGILPPSFVPTPIPEENILLFSPCETNPLYSKMVPVKWSESSRSLYTLYSHLQEKPDFEVGDNITCGRIIGAVGVTGNSVAEHLHLEIRMGPSGAEFGSLAMYTPNATVEERYNYCIWSTSGRFQPIDPAVFWVTQP